MDHGHLIGRHLIVLIKYSRASWSGVHLITCQLIAAQKIAHNRQYYFPFVDNTSSVAHKMTRIRHTPDHYVVKMATALYGMSFKGIKLIYRTWVYQWLLYNERDNVCGSTCRRFHLGRFWCNIQCIQKQHTHESVWSSTSVEVFFQFNAWS